MEPSREPVKRYTDTADLTISEVYEIDEELASMARGSDATRHFYFDRSRMRYFHERQITIGEDELYVHTLNSKSYFFFVPQSVNRLFYVGEMMAKIEKDLLKIDKEKVDQRSEYASYASFKRARIEGVRKVLDDCEKDGKTIGLVEADEYIKRLYSSVSPPASPRHPESE